MFIYFKITMIVMANNKAQDVRIYGNMYSYLGRQYKLAKLFWVTFWHLLVCNQFKF